MLKEYKKTLVLTSIVTLLPVPAGVLLWDRLPEVMATHFGLNNEANGFSGKAFTVFGIPLFLLAIQWIVLLATTHDPRKQNISPKLLALCLWIVPLVSLFCAAVIYPYNLGMQMDTSLVSGLLTGAMFVIIGNYLPKIRQNYTIGIKLPWTLANEENWNRTHRLGGYLWVLTGLVLIILALTGRMGIWTLAVILLPAVLVPCVYSFWLHTARGF